HLGWGSARDASALGGMATREAAAVGTTRMRLGTLVASSDFRHPVSFAKGIITLGGVSAGRFTLGIGAGGDGWDATMLGQRAWSRRERAERFVEFVHLLDRLLRDPATCNAAQPKQHPSELNRT